MRIVSWNVNGIRSAEKRGFSGWLARESPDILCLNETKADPGQLSPKLVNPSAAPLAAAAPGAGSGDSAPDGDFALEGGSAAGGLAPAGARYFSYWACAKKRGYSGVAIYSKAEPLETRVLGAPEFDAEGRALIAEYEAFTLIAAYFPNSQEGGRRLDYKLGFCAEILRLCNSLAKKGRHFLLAGDYNIAHAPIDLARPKQNEGSPGYLPEERAWMDEFTGAGHVDTFRHFHPGEGSHYTWWSYRAQARERNVGWRIDYHCVDRAFLPKVRSSAIRPEVAGSDHCPVEIVLDL